LESSYKTKRQRYEAIRAQLELDRSSFMPSWRDVQDYILPWRAQLSLDKVNRGERRNQKIIDSTGTLAMRNLSSGMMSGITNKAKPWFRMTTPNPKYAEMGNVKGWLHDLTTNMGSILLRSNFYKNFGGLYTDTSGFGTGSIFCEGDKERVIHTQGLPVGSYMIGCDSKGRVNVFFREIRMTVRQLVEKFGESKDGSKIEWSKFSLHVKRLWENDGREQWIDVCHIILPNEEYDPKRANSKFKKFSSCYYEKGTTNQPASGGVENDTYLRESGYDYFPVLCARWATTGQDAWGTCYPGMDMIGDVKALQLMQRRLAEAIEKMNRPPMVGSSALKNTKASILPGDITFEDEMNGGKGFRPAYQVDPRIQEMLLQIQDHQRRIQRAAFEDILLMISSAEDPNRTATEIIERKEEKLTVFGPVLESIDEVLDQFFDILFFEMLEQGLIEDPPEELQGTNLKVEYISIMHQAMKLAGVGGMERFIGNMITWSANAQDPSILHKVDFEQTADVYGDQLSVHPNIIRTDDKVAEIRAAQAKAREAQQKAEMAAQAAGAARDLASADMSGDNALTRMAQGGQQLVQ